MNWNHWIFLLQKCGIWYLTKLKAPLLFSSNSSNAEFLSEYTIISDRSWRRLILLFMVCECSIQINGQSLNWDSINALNNILRFSRVMYPAIRPNALSFFTYFTTYTWDLILKFNSELIDTPNSVSIWLDLTETPSIFVCIEDFNLITEEMFQDLL